MTEEGVVKEVREGRAVIEIKPAGECKSCCLCSGRGARRMTVTGEIVESLAPGTEVIVEIDTSSMTKIYMLLYGAPLAVFVAGIFATYAATTSPLISFSAALAATAIAYILVGRYIRKQPAFTPRITVK